MKMYQGQRCAWLSQRGRYRQEDNHRGEVMKVRGILQVAVGVLCLICVAQGAAAADFVLVNRTNQAILAFQIEAQGQQNSYSTNWLRGPLMPGYAVAMSFRSDEHYCLIRHKMIFEGGAVRRGEVNICTATKLVVGDNGRVTFYTD